MKNSVLFLSVFLLTTTVCFSQKMPDKFKNSIRFTWDVPCRSFVFFHTVGLQRSARLDDKHSLEGYAGIGYLPKQKLFLGSLFPSSRFYAISGKVNYSYSLGRSDLILGFRYNYISSTNDLIDEKNEQHWLGYIGHHFYMLNGRMVVGQNLSVGRGKFSEDYYFDLQTLYFFKMHYGIEVGFLF
jgi:hypothetical protein